MTVRPIPPFCCVPGCDNHTASRSGLPVCGACGVKIAIAHMYDADRLEAVTAQRVRNRDEHRDRMRRGATKTAVVYYILLHPAVVKIGFTSDLKQRLADLRVDRDQILAVEPGGRDLETERHNQFKALRIGRRENFRAEPTLLDHIALIHAEHGLPHWAALPNTDRVTLSKV